MKVMPVLWILMLTLVLAVPQVQALPEYQMKYQQSCGLCHYNPTGGGMRTLYGAQFFSYTDLPANPLGFEEIERIMPKLGEQLQVGADFRGLYVVQNDLDEEIETPGDGNMFVLMQADAYFAYTFSDKTLVHIDISDNGTQEAYAMFSGLPLSGVVRVGRFMPSFGWRVPDHTLYTRRFTGYGSLQGPGPLAYDTGLEVGIYPEGWDVTVGVVNGIPASDGKAVLGRVAKRIILGSLNLSVGASYRMHDVGGIGDSENHSGAFYGAHWGRWTFIGETDYLDRPTLDETGLVSMHQLRYMLKRGLYANAGYEWYDNNLDQSGGYYWRGRFSLDYIPRGYVSFTPSIEWNHDPSGHEYGLGFVQFHLWL